MNGRWKPSVTVAAVIEREGRFLCVEEQTDEGVRINQPAGHLEQGESLIDAVVRETLEETAFVFSPGFLLGVYQWSVPNRDLTYVRFAFGGEVGERVAGRQLDDGILRALWLSVDELRACQSSHRSPLVMRCVEDWIGGRRCDLELLRYYP